MHLQLMHERRDVLAPGLPGQNALLHRKHRGCERFDTKRFELAAGLEAFPGAGDFHAEAGWGESGREMVEEAVETYETKD